MKPGIRTIPPATCEYFSLLILLLLIAMQSIASSAQSPAGAMRPSTVPEGYLITPFGYFHPSCVIHLMKGDVVMKAESAVRHADGSFDSIPVCSYPHYDSHGRIELSNNGNNTTQSDPSISHSWIEDFSATTSSSYGQLKANWVVPPAPTSNDSQTLFFFPGMEDYNDIYTIIQPVLGWNSDFSDDWGIASWNCCVTGTAQESTPVAVNSGDTILGKIQSTCSPGTLSCGSWNITTEDVSSGESTELNQSSSYGQTFNWATAGSLEVYSIIQCSDFPPNGSIAFSNLALYDDSFNQISNPPWQFVNYSSGLTPQCNYGGQETATQVVLDFGSAPPAATPNESNVTVTLNGTPPTSINYSVTLQDATPGATIHYEVTICNSPSVGAAASGTQVEFYNPCPSISPSGTMYATAPGYLQSATTSLSF